MAIDCIRTKSAFWFEDISFKKKTKKLNKALFLARFNFYYWEKLKDREKFADSWKLVEERTRACDGLLNMLEVME